MVQAVVGPAIGGAGLLSAFLGNMIGSVILASALTTLQNPLNVLGNQTFPLLPPDVGTLIRLRQRQEIDDATYKRELEKSGIGAEAADYIITSAEFYPTPSDLVMWQAREVYEPDAVAKYGLDAELDNVEQEPFAKAGVTPEQVRNFWRAHWQHPSYQQVTEMLHRDIISDVADRDTVTPGTPAWEALRAKEIEDLYEWYRLVEVPPYWRQKLTETAYNPYTRVDIRRMYDLRVVDEEEVLRNYLDLGSDLEHAEKLTAFTLIDTEFPDLIARYGNGWINREQLSTRLIQLGLPPERAEEFIQTRIDNLARPQRIANERDLTKSEIIKGVKSGIIGYDFGVQALQDMGYDEFEAEYIMLINIESQGSPEGPAGIRQIVESYRRSVGMQSNPVDAAVVETEKNFKSADRALIDAEGRNARDSELQDLQLKRNQAMLAYRMALQRAGINAPEAIS
jgi:hypothetical protein